ncbi:hypothetical protein NQ314_007960 [Rhamnusium bicolor]|uniref:Uncharacterized protein n=1 Tax=Rhamnusium bicolor TaxID=1586634 RepID=A0AAV8YH08_9CUCU|nr:hypothetical protein NQ314_007960 [Rhamnusium bicolor]
MDYQSSVLKDSDKDKEDYADQSLDSDNLVMTNSDLTKSSDTTYSDISTNNCTSESLTSSVSTPDTIVSRIPRRKTPSRIPISPARVAVNNNNNNNKENTQETKIPKSKIPHKSNKPKLKVRHFFIKSPLTYFACSCTVRQQKFKRRQTYM